MVRGWLYLVAILDWFSRYVLSWEVSVTLEADFCVAALRRALAQRTPQIFNTDQGSQFTSVEFTGILRAAGVQISMDGQGRVFDNIYTERFMRLPQENKTGYDENSPINFADKLKGKFLLIHGTSDDNVHVQNSMDLITALNKANKQYSMFIYPNKNHNISGGNTRLHLYTLMTDFILENL